MLLDVSPHFTAYANRSNGIIRVYDGCSMFR